MRDSQKVFDELLALKIREGDHRAFELLVKRWNKSLIAFVYRFTHDFEVSKDIIQECWISIYQGLNKLQEPEKIKPWMYRIAHNKTIDYLRKHSKTTSTDFPEDVQAEEKSDEVDDRVELIRKLINQLPAQQKAILTLFYLERQPIKEIANILKVPIGTIKSRIFYAREKLKRKYKEVYNETYR